MCIRDRFRHVQKVHPVPAGDQRQRKADGGDDGEQLHQLVQVDVHLGLVGFPDFGDVIPQVEDAVEQPVHPDGHPMKVFEGVGVQQVVGVLLDERGDVVELFVIPLEGEELFAKMDNCLLYTSKFCPRGFGWG